MHEEKTSFFPERERERVSSVYQRQEEGLGNQLCVWVPAASSSLAGWGGCSASWKC